MTTIYKLGTDIYPSVDSPNHLQFSIDFSDTGRGTVAAHKLLEVTGMVSFMMWGYITTEIVVNAGGNATLDVVGRTAATSIRDGGSTIAATCAAGNYVDAIGFHSITNALSYGAEGYIISAITSQSIDYLITDVALDSGVIEWHCVWSPMTTGATVTAGDGTVPA